MSKIQSTNISSFLQDVSGIGEFLLQGALNEMEIDGLDMALKDYTEMVISGKSGIKPNASSFTDNYSENNPYYKDSGSTTITGANLGDLQKAIWKTLKDKGSSTEGKKTSNWDISINFGKGFNPFQPDEIDITSFKNVGNFKNPFSAENFTTSFSGQVTLIRDSEGQFTVKDGWTINSFTDVWSDNNPDGKESGSVSIQSKAGLTFKDGKLTGNVDSISWTYKDNDGVTHTFSSGPLSSAQLEGLEYLLKEKFDENSVDTLPEDIEAAVKKFILGGNDEITAAASKTGEVILEGGLGDDTYIITKLEHMKSIRENQDEGFDTVKIKFNGGKTGATAVDLGQIPESIEQIVIEGKGFFVVSTAQSEHILSQGQTLALIGEEFLVLDKGQTLMNFEGADAITSSASINLAENSPVITAVLQGKASVDITGNGQANTLIGNDGNNKLDGGAGADRMVGGKGNDTYYVDNADDEVIEKAGEGTDTVMASVSYALAANVENLTLVGVEDLSGTGNELNNTIKGNDGNNTLNGGAGVDRLEGGKGDDTYIVDLVAKGVTKGKDGSQNYSKATAALEDTIVEGTNAGSDTVKLRLDDAELIQNLNQSTTTTTLTLGANLENLDASQTGNLKLNLTGNAADNVLIGNDADNVINGGKGVDTMRGGKGNDTYIVDDVRELALLEEKVDEGHDAVQIAFAGGKNKADPTPIIAPDNIEQVTITGNGFFNVTLAGAEYLMTKGDTLALVNGEAVLLAKGQSLEQIQVGVDEDDVDAISSSASISLEGPVINAAVLLGKAAANLTGNTAANTLIGNAGNNKLDGGAGADYMAGGKGNDTYVVDDDGDVVLENDGEGVDTVIASVDYELTANVENLTLVGNEDLNGTGNELKNTIKGNEGNNRLDGGAGVDRLEGGKGDDTYIVDLVAKGVTKNKDGSLNYTKATVALEDTIVEGKSAGDDTVQLRLDSSLIESLKTAAKTTTLTLGANLENLDASHTGGLKLNLTGNAADNILTGNDAGNVLNGGTGNDVLYGGAGNDVLIGGAGADIMTGGEGKDVFKITSLKDLGLGDAQDIITDFVVGQDVIDLSALKSGKNVWNFNKDSETSAARNVWVKYEPANSEAGTDAYATIFFEANGKDGDDYSIKLLGVSEGITEESFVFA